MRAPIAATAGRAFSYEEIEETASGRTIYILDARYTRIRSADFGTERGEVTKD